VGRWLLSLAVVVALGGCSCLPDWKAEPDAVTAHFRVRTVTSRDPALARHVGALAEGYRTALAGLFGVNPGTERALPILVYTDPAAYTDARSCVDLDEHVPGFTISFVGEEERFACVRWIEEGWSSRTLVHELVHEFTARTLPKDLPTWKDEGLAAALAHGVDDLTTHDTHLWRCPVLACSRLADDELRVMIGEAMRSRAVVYTNAAGALVRFGLETGGWADARSIVAWEPDVDAFLEWIRSTPRERWHTRLLPVRAGGGDLSPAPASTPPAPAPTPR